MEVYENHLGGIYFSTEVYDFDDLYCEVCGDSDWHLGHADTWEEVLDMLKDDEGWIPYSEEYLKELKGKWEAE